VLRAAAAATGADRQFLLGLADVVAARKRDAQTPCDGTPLWSGQHPSCTWLGDGSYSTGLLRSGETRELLGKSWAPLVFTPLQYPYQEGIWRGPLLVVVNGDTGSAAEQFAAELQDNHAAVIVGSPTVGAGCGQTDGGTPTTLENSGGVLRMPDCVRMRNANLNLASGVQPDVLVGFRAADSSRRQAALLEAKLPEAANRAAHQGAARSSPRP
jgi:Peptidase family S41